MFGLPIKHYDFRILRFIGNRIGKSYKVDKNTSMEERGKYARICVGSRFIQALIAMFITKGRKYIIEYEGSHLLCIGCGKFGHYQKGFPKKHMQNDQDGKVIEIANEECVGQGEQKENNIEGSWVVVQKTRKPRKTRDMEVMGEFGLKW